MCERTEAGAGAGDVKKESIGAEGVKKESSGAEGVKKESSGAGATLMKTKSSEAGAVLFLRRLCSPDGNAMKFTWTYKDASGVIHWVWQPYIHAADD